MRGRMQITYRSNSTYRCPATENQCTNHALMPLLLYNTNSTPSLTGWDSACQAERSNGEPHSRSRNSHQATINHDSSRKPWRTLAALDPAMSSAATAINELRVLASHLESDLSRRDVLCGHHGDQACKLRVLNATAIRVCLPRAAAVQRTRICEPWGEPWQAAGGAIGEMGEGGCVDFDVLMILRFFHAVQHSRHSPLISSATDPWLQRRLERKRGPRFTRRSWNQSREFEEFRALLSDTIPVVRRATRHLLSATAAASSHVEVADDEDETRYVTIEGQVFDMVD